MLNMLQGTLTRTENGIQLSSPNGEIAFCVSNSRLFLLQREKEQFYIVPVHLQNQAQTGFLLWILPDEIESTSPCLLIRPECEQIVVSTFEQQYCVTIRQQECFVQEAQNRPRRDVFGNAYSFETENGEMFEQTLAAFYWDSILPMTAERTLPKNSRYQNGYVLSTLQQDAYPSTYPDVDHEFQIKGRIALGDPLSLDIVRRMMELLIAVMKKDPSGRWRNPCAIRRNGYCEYHVPRRSKNLRKRALMFLLTGNIELIESAWLYLLRSKDTRWLEQHIEDLEHVISLVERYIDKDFRLWSEVYYEDQVIKHGRETIAQAFAVNSFRLLSKMEHFLQRDEMATRYEVTANRLSETLSAPYPLGYWDAQQNRFLDWVDKNGTPHDHIHLLANELPALFGCVSREQSEHIANLIHNNDDVFLKFPSFVAAKIEDYTANEIGSGGPYDLCAAGRYWCWDAAYRHSRADADVLFLQLSMVAEQAKLDGFCMGERYDMNYVYYQSETNWHGAAHYYEYPNVFAWVLLQEYFGIRPQIDCDYLISPCLSKDAHVRYGKIEYTLCDGSFSVRNISAQPITLRVDLSKLAAHSPKSDQQAHDASRIFILKPDETISFAL